ncbi:hypothetical protein ARMSODRAFT_1022562 [Armillaria solidipes]|uniref:Uncharacterized protein n=1 Tax=Armillaria solidipes TaxID=1076256 RepID=A0A2H3B8E5_9AGAR|nr:hypothetical protein ARMSODRAFT_1022562 [Armillaria solidipes]
MAALLGFGTKQAASRATTSVGGLLDANVVEVNHWWGEVGLVRPRAGAELSIGWLAEKPPSRAGDGVPGRARAPPMVRQMNSSLMMTAKVFPAVLASEPR